MFKNFLLILCIFLCNIVFAQKDDYIKNLRTYQKEYVETHEVVKGKDKKYFRFFPVTKKYNVQCTFERIIDSVGFTMNTSAKTQKHFFKYGKLSFIIDGNEYHLYAYQSKDLQKDEIYKNYLFVPFTDATTGDESYGSGRYIDILIDDIKNNQVQLDFNKAYNPYCAYSPNYKCPIPPRENFLSVAIKAGEMNFAKSH